MKLTHRERQVAFLAADGKAAATIASELGINVRTVHNHLNSARRKKNAKNTLELAAYIRLKRKPVQKYTDTGLNPLP